MKVHVDEERCEGHGRCYDLAPSVLAPDDEGRAVLVGDGVIRTEDEQAAKAAVRNCPERALRSEV